MTIYNSSRKRMVISKYSNRPPFELKTNESSVTSKTSEKFKKSLESINKSYNSIIKQLDNIDKKQPAVSGTNKNIVPKIIESFQKITPKREVIIVRNRNYLSSQDSSVQTLFRNKNSNFGKHIPKHRMMANLLKNFGSGTRMFIEHDQVDTIPTRDTECLRKSRDHYDKIKVDKTTSTSGIIWPVNQTYAHHRRNDPEKNWHNKSQIPHYCSTKTVDKTKSKIPKRKNATRGVEQKVKNEEKETASKITDSELITSTNTDRTHVHTREHTYIIDEENTGEKNGTSRTLKKEDSFVQRQIEKLNKMGNKKQGRKKSSKTVDFQKRNWNLNKNYLGMMTSARKGFPKIEEKFLEHATTDDYDWSDAADTIKPEVKFPKETRHAMETIILQNSAKFERTPLSRYLKHRNPDLQPAIPSHQGDGEGNTRSLGYPKKGPRDRRHLEGMGENMEEGSPCKCSDRRFRKCRPRMIPMKCKQ